MDIFNNIDERLARQQAVYERSKRRPLTLSSPLVSDD